MNATRYSKIVFILCGFAAQLSATINFGSRDSGFVVSGGTLNLGSGAVLTDGSLRDSGGSITASAASCNGLSVEVKDGATIKKMMVSGTMTLGSTLSLGNNQKLLVSGGSVAEAVTAAGAAATPSIIEGFGRFGSAITVADDKQLNMRWNGPLNANILLNASNTKTSTLLLEQDLLFAPGYAVTASDTSGATNKIDFNGYHLSLGGDETASTSIANAQTWKNANVSLSGPVTIANDKTITLSTSGAYIAGNGHRLAFGNSGSVLANGGNPVTFNDVILADLTSASLAGSGDWTFINTRLEDSSSALMIDGSVTSSTMDVFGGNATFGANTRIALLRDLTPGGTWTVTGALSVHGNGHILNCAASGARFVLSDSSSLLLEDIILTRVIDDSFDTSAATNVYLSNVTYIQDNGCAVRILGSGFASGVQAPALVSFAAASASGDIFGTDTSWQNGAHIELLNDVALACSWTFEDDGIIEGNGHRLDLSSGRFAVASGKTLRVRNVVLDNIATASLSVGGASSVLQLSEVTIRLSGNVDWSTGINTTVNVDGSLYVITGNYTWTVKAGSVLNGITACYDTLSAVDGNNIVGFSGTGRTSFVAVPVQGTVSITSSTDVVRNDYLFPHPDDDGIKGHELSFSGDGSIIYAGHGRSLFFPYTNADMTNKVVLTVAGDTTVFATGMSFEGLNPAHLSISADGGLYFCDNTLVRLHDDWVLDKEIAFGSSSLATNESMILDLNGHVIDMSDDNAALTLRGSTGCVLRIRNGRIAHLSGTKIAALANSKIIFEDVELCLSVSSAGDYTFANAALDFEGHCCVSGIPGTIFNYTSVANLTIKRNACLSVLDGLIYSHNNTGLTNFVMEDATARLELMGGVFRRPASSATDPLLLTCGTLVVDHKSIIQPGTDGIYFGDGLDSANNLSVEIRPGATITIASDGVTTGTLTLANI